MDIVSERARRLGSVLEPVIGQVYFSPECHANYVALGFAPSTGHAGGVALPDGPAYFASRGSLLGQVPGQVIAAAFGVFSAAVVVPSVEFAWTRTDAATIRAARADGAVAQLRRLLGERPEGTERALELLRRAAGSVVVNGRAMAAGIAALDVPDDPLAAVWHTGDLLREYRGDCHNATWIAADLSATDIGQLTELYWGLPARSYSRTRGWTEDEFDRSAERLVARGLLDAEASALTPAGRELREELEVRTDAQMAPVIDALGDDVEEVFEILEPWGAKIRAGDGYLPSGPHDLLSRSREVP
jgi:hypothetical protein